MAGTSGKSKKAGRQGRSAAHSRYNSEMRWKKNKALKTAKHKKKLSIQADLSKKRQSLLAEAIEKTRKSEYKLKREFGTLNIHRLTQIVDGTYKDSNWYKLRVKKRDEKNDVRKVANKSKKTKNKHQKRKKTERVSRSTNPGNSET